MTTRPHPNAAENAGMTAVRNSRDDSAFALQKQILETAATIFDIGGHMGQTSERYLTLYPDAEIHYFEPQEKAVRQAEKHLSGQNVHINNTAVADAPGEATFHINGFTAASSLQVPHEKAADNWPAAAMRVRKTVTVPVTTVDAYCEERNIDAIDILKIDVQGHEYRVLQGARDLLSRGGIKLVYFEYIHCDTYAEQTDLAGYFKLLDGYGYRLVSIFNLVQGARGLNQCDLLFELKS